MHQADILYLPDDNGFKYLLVVVDVATRRADVEPLKDITTKDTMEGIKKIYKRKILNKPNMIQVDNGGEFKGDFLKWFNDNDIIVRYGRPGREKQLGLAKGVKSYIEKVISNIQALKEYQTGKPYNEWLKHIKPIMNEYNKGKKMKKKNPPEKPPRCKGNTCELLNVGDNVRVVADQKKDILNRKNVKYRHGILRWNPEVREIERLILRRNTPPMYIVKGIPNVAYTRNSLQKVEE